MSDTDEAPGLTITRENLLKVGKRQLFEPVKDPRGRWAPEQEPPRGRWAPELEASVEPFSVEELKGMVDKIIVEAQEETTEWPLRAAILDEASNLTTGGRNVDHGDPLHNHATIAGVWSALLGIEITPAQVALCMAGMKLARLAYNPTHHDSAVDAAAYAAIAGELAARA